MMDRVMAIASLLMLFAFLAVVPIFVPHVDLIIVVVGCAVLATYDVWRSISLRQR
jgi:hypothetical protein